VIPYHDENATIRPPIVTFLLLAMNIAAWVALDSKDSKDSQDSQDPAGFEGCGIRGCGVRD
jgi:hypothetical protein